MEFAKFYDVAEIVKKMILNGELENYSYSNFKGVYVCMDTNDFWVCRVSEGHNANYQKEEGKFLVERNKIDKYDIVDFYIKRNENNDNTYSIGRKTRDVFLDSLEMEDLIKTVLIFDDDNGLENWDDYECGNLEEAIEIIDDGYGIIKI